ncbi:Serine/threonine-protein kinase PBS1 [Apostasia shenzhenica]|uniref:Serine/threonine-protein kinase PBS1 n=1 Tax=Apostasia shenzhenica TaxID=1088818 RepID=A0A2I0AAU2_9ASPA|nr:Serine/threonine-protein kinase PBS1 [Apostasia shenzhenica]
MDLPPSKQAEREFRVEVDLLSRLEHPNLVTLIGYCADGKHRFLVYEFMPIGNLQDALNGMFQTFIQSEAITSTLSKHYSDALREFALRIQESISDFGLAKLMPEDEGIYANTRMLGTFGYFDPEYALTGKLTLQSDVYAFGVVLLELLTGRRALELNQGTADQNLILQIRNILQDRKKLRKVIDPEMARSSYNMESITMFALLASRCVRIESNARPIMAECVKELQVILYASIKA